MQMNLMPIKDIENLEVLLKYGVVSVNEVREFIGLEKSSEHGTNKVGEMKKG